MGTRRKLLPPRWRKVLADLWEGKTRTMLVVASIAVGVFAIGAIATTYAILSTDLDLSYAAINPANIEMVVTPPFDDEFLPVVERLPGVALAEGRQSVSVRVSANGVDWINLSLLASENMGATRISQLRPRAGATIPGEREVLVANEMMRDTGLRTGDLLQVQLSDGTLRRLRVAGEVGDQTSSHDALGTHRGFVTEDTLVWLGGSRRYDRLLVTVSRQNDDEDYIQRVADEIEDKVEKNGGTVYSTGIFRSDEFPMADMAMAIFGILGLLGALVVLLSGSLIVNTLNALFAQQLRQIGVMKLVGARGRQVLGMYLLLILLYSLLALVIAAPLGAWAGYKMAEMMGSMFNAELQGFRIIPMALVIQVVIAIGVPLAAGIIPVRNGSRISVRRAISSDSMEGQPSGAPGRVSRLGGSLLSRPVLLSIRNTFRRKRRLALTLFTLTTAGAIFIAVFNVRASMDDYLDELMQHFQADVTLSFEQSYRVDRITRAVLEVPGVQAVEAWSGAAAEILDPRDNKLDDLTIVAPPADTPLLSPELVAGRWLRAGDQRALVISNGIYSLYPDLQPGDSLRLRISSDRIEDWTVVGVFSYTGMLGNTLSYADYEYVADLNGTPGHASSYRVITAVHDRATQEALCAALDRHLRSLNLQVDEIEAGMVTREQASSAITILIVFLLSMALLTAFVGSIGLAGTMGMNVLERTREIGVMRAIGAVDLAIVKSVVIEGMLIGLISWAFAWALSFPISYVMLRIISTAMMSDPVAISFTLVGTLIWLAVVVVLSAIASIAPARSAARLTIREVLAYE